LVDAATDLGFEGYVIDRKRSLAPNRRAVLASLTDLPRRIESVPVDSPETIRRVITE